MGRLKPGATYVYEHYNGITYARESGAPYYERFEIGRTLERQVKDSNTAEDNLWHDILREATGNEELQYALERVKIIYHLSKNNGQE